MAEQELKRQNVPSLTGIYVGTFLLVSLVQWGVEDAFALTSELTKQASLIAALTAFGAVLSNVLPNSAKHSLVFFRFRNALAGHRCKQICTNDPRLSVAYLEDRWPEMFAQHMDSSAQNSYWYREVYLPVRNAPEVAQAHRSFLLYRDSASGLFVILIGLLIWRVFSAHVSLPSPGPLSFLVLVGIDLLLIRAGAQSGNRMVANAAALQAKERE